MIKSLSFMGENTVHFGQFVFGDFVNRYVKRANSVP